MQKVLQKILIQFFKIVFIKKYFILKKKSSFFFLFVPSYNKLHISKISHFKEKITFVYQIDVPVRSNYPILKELKPEV